MAAPDPRLIFSHTLEGLFIKALKDRFTPALRAEVKALGVDFDRPLEPAYPYDVWARVLEATARAIYPQLSLEQGCERLGWELMHGFFDTSIGALMRGAVKMFGPTRTLLRAGRTLRTGNNYTEVTTTHLGGNRYELVFNEGPLTRDAMQGCVRAGLELAGAKGVRIVSTPLSADSVKLTIDWS